MQLEEDLNWNVEVLPGATPRGFKALNEQLINNSLVCYSNRNTYVYLFASNCWSVFVSAEAQIQLCGIVGSDNASVNYLSACTPYIRHLEANAQRLRPIPPSINIGTRRLAIFRNEKDNSLNFIRCEELVDVQKQMDPRVSGFCVMPCMIYKHPLSWTPGGEERLLKYITPLFHDSTNLATFRWILGNALVDPSSVSKFLLLYGQGGTGKSTLISIIEDCFKGCCATIRSTVLTEAKLDAKTQQDTDKAVASNRVVTAGDINLATSKLNLHTVKELTGHDSISVPPLKVATSCSVIAACNNLPRPSVQKDWCTTALSRRTAVLFMNVDTTKIPRRLVPNDEYDVLDFLFGCTDMFLKTPYMPLSTECLLYGILGGDYIFIKDKIQIYEKCTVQEVFDANTKIEVYLGLQLHTIGALASLMSPSSVIHEGTIPFVNNIRLLEELPDYI